MVITSMGTTTATYEAMVVSQKRVEYSLQIGEGFLSPRGNSQYKITFICIVTCE